MRIVAKSTLKAFWEEYPDSEKPLKIWYEKIKMVHGITRMKSKWCSLMLTK
jgi:mRNA-degrading endonuclease HigB of HigAB toxin-antitoxin module